MIEMKLWHNMTNTQSYNGGTVSKSLWWLEYNKCKCTTFTFSYLNNPMTRLICRGSAAGSAGPEKTTWTTPTILPFYIR